MMPGSGYRMPWVAKSGDGEKEGQQVRRCEGEKEKNNLIPRRS